MTRAVYSEEARRYRRWRRRPEWREIRAAFIAASPCCEPCRARGVLRRIEVVRHRRHPGRSRRMFRDFANIIGLCLDCHLAAESAAKSAVADHGGHTSTRA